MESSNGGFIFLMVSTCTSKVTAQGPRRENYRGNDGLKLEMR